ncbi:MAG: glycosyltransferase, partial [Chloroflexota bacterium]
MSRLAIVAHSVFPGDPRLRRQTDALVAAGHQVDLFCLRAPGEATEERVGGIRVVRLPVHRAFSGFAGH